MAFLFICLTVINDIDSTYKAYTGRIFNIGIIDKEKKNSYVCA